MPFCKPPIFPIEKDNPDLGFIKALEKYLPSKGSVIVWNKAFERGINLKLMIRNVAHVDFFENLNDRLVDLEVPFKKQFYIHPGFKGKTSIKYVLPTLAPSFSYKDLNIQEGGAASDTWNKIISGKFADESVEVKSKDLLIYCKLDTLAMYEIWKNCLEQF